MAQLLAPAAPPVRTRRGRQPLLVTALVVLCWASLAAWVGYQAVDPAWARESLLVPSPASPSIGFGTILATNLGAVLLLYSGAATAGLTTLIATTWTGAYVGATLAVGVENAGLGPLLARVWVYLPLELSAMLVAAIAGTYPLISALLTPTRHDRGVASTAVRRYLDAARASLLLLAGSGCVLLAAAALEAAVIR